MRDVAFLVRLPEGATGIQRSRHLLEGLLPEDEIRSQEKQTRKEISSVMQGNLCGVGRGGGKPPLTRLALHQSFPYPAWIPTTIEHSRY